MPEARFPILGPTVPPLVGRKDVMQRLWTDLTKRTPSHLSVVGPRYIGKSVILHELARRMREEDSPYDAVILWDLKHQTPGSDGAFLAGMSRHLADGIRTVNSDYADHLLTLEGHEYSELCEVIEALNSDDVRILMIWDGFDEPLATGQLTRNLWDQLRELASYRCLRLVTATRRNLQELIRSEESITSDFWGIFDTNPVKVRNFTEADREAVYEASGISFFSPARTELENWTGGFPPLFLIVVNSVLAEAPTTGADNASVNTAAQNSRDRAQPFLADLWADCDARSKDLLLLLLERGEAPSASVSHRQRNYMKELGFITEHAGFLRASCRLLQEYVKDAGTDSSAISRLFGASDTYKANIREFLEQRLSHLSRVDNRLYRYVESAIGFLPDDPDIALNNLTSIEERALDLIWEREFGADRIVPLEVRSYWTTTPRDREKLVKAMMDEDNWQVPSDRGRQIGMLQLLTGSRPDFDSKANATSKDAYVLINAIHSYRNRNQHAGGEEMILGVAVAALITCVELLACLDIAPPTSQGRNVP